MSDSRLTMHEKLDEAIAEYEKYTGFEAIAYRQLSKQASLKRRIEAAQRDLDWFNDNNEAVSRDLSHAIERAKYE